MYSLNDKISNYTEDDLNGLRKSGQIVSIVLQEMLNVLKPGISPKQLDQIAEKYFKKLDAKSAPILEGFPGNTCISVNEIIAHGIPNRRMLEPGDRINIDVSAVHDGFFGDVAYTAILTEDGFTTNALLNCAKAATIKAAKMSLSGTPVNQIAKTMEDIARRNDFTIIKNLCSHGVGKSLHAYPENIVNYYDAEETLELQAGMVIAWEPYVSTCAVRAIETDSEWNLTTHNKSDVAQYEHTVLVTDGEPELLTYFP